MVVKRWRVWKRLVSESHSLRHIIKSKRLQRFKSIFGGCLLLTVRLAGELGVDSAHVHPIPADIDHVASNRIRPNRLLVVHMTAWLS